MNLIAFSKNDGVPSTSSKASKIGLPMTGNFTGFSFTAREMHRKINLLMIGVKNHSKQVIQFKGRIE